MVGLQRSGSWFRGAGFAERVAHSSPWRAWQVWDKKKDQEEVRRAKYSTALTSYIAGNKIVGREEPPAAGGSHGHTRVFGFLA